MEQYRKERRKECPEHINKVLSVAVKKKEKRKAYFWLLGIQSHHQRYMKEQHLVYIWKIYSTCIIR